MKLKKPETVRFTSVAKVIVPEKHNKFLSKASLEDLRGVFGSDFKADQTDLVYAAANIAVVNMANKNHDLMLTSDALSCYKNFVHKAVNVEHSEVENIGTIIKSAFSSYPDSKLISEAEIVDSKAPFNIVLGFAIWKRANPELANLIVEASDPNSDKYGLISSSWEISYDEIDILVQDKEVSKGYLMSDDEEIEKAMVHLKGYGGSGRLPDGRSIYRVVTGDLIPLGIGLTTSPAADVKGVLTLASIFNNPDDETWSAPEKSQTDDVFPADPEDSESPELAEAAQQEENSVKDNSNKTFMKIKKISDINSDNWEKIEASDVSEFIAERITEKDAEYQAQIAAEVAAKEAIANEAKENSEKLEKAEEEIVKLKAALDEIKIAQEAAEAKAKFDARMGELDETYELGAEDRRIIARRIADLSDEDYATWAEEFSVIASEKNRANIVAKAQAIADAAEEAKVVAASETSVASVEESDDSQVSDDVLDDVAPAAVTKITAEEIYAKYREQFAATDFGFSVK